MRSVLVDIEFGAEEFLDPRWSAADLLPEEETFWPGLENWLNDWEGGAA